MEFRWEPMLWESVLRVKTGVNEAFVISLATPMNSLSKIQNSAELLKPFLQGRELNVTIPLKTNII